MIIYLIKVQVLLLVAAALYMLFFSKETNFRFKRYFILSAVALSFSLPFIKPPAFLSKELSQSIVQQLPVNSAQEDEFFIDPRLFEEQATKKYSFQDYLLVSYLAVATLLSIKLLIQLRNIFAFIFKHRKTLQKKEGYYIAEINGKVPTFSFLNFLFLNREHWENEKEREQILTHEIEHVKQGHTFDIILLEFAAIVCWFNPAVYFFKSQIRAIHEYLADARVLDQTQDIGYARLLVRSALSTLQLRLVNQFHNSLTLKRLSMMKTVKKNMNKWKLGMLIPGIAVAVFIIACQDQIIAEMEEVSKTTTIMSEFPVEFSEDVAKIRAKHPDYILTYMEAEEGNREKIAKVNIDNILHLKVFEKDGAKRVGMIVKYDDNLYNLVNSAAPKDDSGEIFLIVEETATPVGGMAVFYEFIQKTIQYPSEARSKGIEGRVFIEFVVNTDGSVSDIKAIRGIGGGCDEEAVRIVSMSPNWNPGKQSGKAIRQRMVLPIIFKIGGSGSNPSEHQVETQTQLSTVHVVGYPRNNQDNPTNTLKKDGDAFIVIDEAAAPTGGITGFYDYVKKNMQYPSEAISKRIEGRVFIEFVVNTDGSISNVLALKGIGAGCDEEAIRIVSNSPAWNPGKHNGEIVKQKMVLPITFELKK